MRKITIAAIAAAMALVAVTPAQDNMQNSSSITSGPWMMRKSTGDKTTDRLWYIMDRTLNAADMDTLKSMFRAMPGNTAYTVQKAILGAIDQNATSNTSYGSWTSTDWANDNGWSDYAVYHKMLGGLSWTEHGAFGNWESNATDSQMAAVAKLIRKGGWANSMWNSSGMNNG